MVLIWPILMRGSSPPFMPQSGGRYDWESRREQSLATHKVDFDSLTSPQSSKVLATLGLSLISNRNQLGSCPSVHISLAASTWTWWPKFGRERDPMMDKNLTGLSHIAPPFFSLIVYLLMLFMLFWTPWVLLLFSLYFNVKGCVILFC